MEDASLEHTPTWAVAAVWFIIVPVALAAERFLHYLGKGDVPFLSPEALHQLHIFIFVLGLVHVVFCATTILLAGAKIRRWKHWETEIHREIHQKLQQMDHVGNTTRLHVLRHRDHQGEFVSEQTKGFWKKVVVVSWIIAFLKQFHDSVSKSDYEALRSAFILIHYPSSLDFDFHKYMTRALKHDIKRIVSISWYYLWLFVTLFILLNINGWHTYLWLAFLPLFLLLIVGTKLQHIIIQFAQEAATSLADETNQVPKIKPSKEHFWFGKPSIVLHLIHFILFQNASEIGFFFWVLVTYGFNSCIMEKKAYAISRLVIGLVIQVACSYITLPLYAIVTHMGGDINLQALSSGLHESLTNWAMEARKKGRSDTRLRNSLTWKKTGTTNPVTGPSEIAVTQPPPPNELFSNSRNMLAPATFSDEDEIMSVVDIDEVDNRR